MKYRICILENGEGKRYYAVQKKGLWWTDVWFDQYWMPSVFSAYEAIVCNVDSLDKAKTMLENCRKSDKCVLTPVGYIRYEEA